MGEDVEEDHHQWNQRQNHGERAKRLGDFGDDLPAAGIAHAAAASSCAGAVKANTVVVRRFVLQMRRRETMLTKIVMINSNNPISINACKYNSSAASLNSLAITAAMVYCGLNSDSAMTGALPMTIVTAIVSPSARPRPSMMAPMIPVLP